MHNERPTLNRSTGITCNTPRSSLIIPHYCESRIVSNEYCDWI